MWQDGVLTQLLMKDSSLDQCSVRDTARWFVLEGNLTSTQFDLLLSYISPESSLNLSNGKTVQLCDSVRFILEVSLGPRSHHVICNRLCDSEDLMGI